jgi:hypothetical protein
VRRELADPDVVLFRAITISASAARVFRWLCQLRAAPYSYDLLDNLGRRSPRTLTPGLEALAVGQRFMTIFRLASFEPDRQITLVSRTRLFGTVAVSYLVLGDGDRSRLVVKLRVRRPGGIAGRLLFPLLPPGDLVMMRKQLRTLARLAEQDGQRRS